MTISTNELLARDCAPTQTALDDAKVAAWLPAVPGWAIEGGMLCRQFKFGNYYQTIAFANALVYITHTQDHHPELAITYNTCTVRYATHSVNQGQGGLSENDFICAAKASALFPGTVTAA